MLLVYLLLFLYLSSSVCEANSLNHRLVLPTGGRVPSTPASSTMTMPRRLLRAPMQQQQQQHSLSSYSHEHEHVQDTIAMQQQQGPSPSPHPGVTLARDAVQEGSLPPAQQDTVMPPPRGGDSGVKEAAVAGVAVGSVGGSSDLTDDQPEEDAVDMGVDYVPPKTHPPSHN